MRPLGEFVDWICGQNVGVTDGDRPGIYGTRGRPMRWHYLTRTVDGKELRANLPNIPDEEPIFDWQIREILERLKLDPGRWGY